jgi:hypothetical protein
MFGELLNRTKASIETERSVLKTNDGLRAVIFATEPELVDLKERVRTQIGTLPDPTLWRVHDHCAAITRLYAIYERFVVEDRRRLARSAPETSSRLSIPGGERSQRAQARHRTSSSKSGLHEVPPP